MYLRVAPFFPFKRGGMFLRAQPSCVSLRLDDQSFNVYNGGHSDAVRAGGAAGETVRGEGNRARSPWRRTGRLPVRWMDWRYFMGARLLALRLGSMRAGALAFAFDGGALIAAQ